MSSPSYEERVAEMSRLLVERAAVYPVRDATYERLLAGAEDFTRYLLAGLDNIPFSPDPAQIESGARLAESPVFICGAMKSGTTLVTQLLDGHPDLIVLPGDAHYAQMREEWAACGFEALAIHWLRRIIVPSGKEPFWFLGQERDGMERFLLYLRHYHREGRHEPFLCVVLALHAAMRPSGPPARQWVEKTPENERYALELAARFPRARFIHILRDPLRNLAALKKLSEYRNKPFLAKRRAKGLIRLFEAGEANAAALGPERYRTIHYWDLVRNTEKVMREISGFLGIAFDPCLLTPTENGRPGVANSMYAELRIPGQVIDRTADRRYLEAFTPEEIDQIVAAIGKSAARFGFKWTREDLKR